MKQLLDIILDRLRRWQIGCGLKTLPKPTEADRSKAIAEDKFTFNDSEHYVGECVYSHTDSNGCIHFKIEWEAA